MRKVLVLGVLMAAVGAAPGAATPLNYVVQPSSTLSANVSGSLDIAVNTSLGTVNGTANAAGPLSATPTGNAIVEWGSPDWDSQIDVSNGDVTIDNLNPGSANGTANLDLFGFIPVNFDLTISLDNIGLGLATDFSAPTTPLDPGTAGAGPWSATDIVDLALSAQLDFSATGPFGIAIGADDIGIGPSVVPAIPLTIDLARLLLGTTNVGSEITLDIAGLSISLPPQPTTNVATPGCEVPGPFGTCLLNVNSVDITLSSLVLSDITGTVVATNLTSIPEPGTLMLLGGGLLALASRRRAA